MSYYLIPFAIILLVLPHFGFSASAAVEIDEKIVGGSPISIKDARYQVSLHIKGKFACGGSLIRYNWILTAGHCTAGVTLNEIKVRAGSDHTYTGGVLADVEKIINHADYKPKNNVADIALLKIHNSFEPYKDSYPIRTIQLATQLPLDGSICMVTGFGELFSDGPLPKQLQKVFVKKINKSLCNKNYEGDLSPTNFCAGIRTGGKDSCQGDSGGPLVKHGKQIGIVSFGNGCAQGKYPGVYMSVPYMHQWILHAIKNN